MCDVTKFFLMVKRCKFDLQFQRFIYRHSPDRMPIVYKLLTVIFGDRSAPYVSSEVLLNLCNIIGDNYTRAKEAIRDDRYVDDIASGNNNEQELVSLYKEVQQLLEIGGFHLAKSFTNSPKLFEYLQEKRVDELSAKAHAVFDYEDRELDKDLSMFKILGLGLSRDLEFLTPQFCDSVELKLKEINGRWSKRSLSSLISTCFDPLGHFAPTILFGKLLLQRVWKQASDTLVDVKKSWDLSIVEEDILQDIDKFIENIRALRDFRIPRLCINPDANEMKLVCFVDASAKSYGACFYLIGKVNTTSVSSLQNVGDGNSYPKNVGDIPNSCNNSANVREQLFRTSYHFSKEQFSNTSDRFSGRPRNQITDINGTSVKLIFARSRLCPTKSKVTIARLELMSCTLGAELNKFVSGALNLDPFKTRLYTDSQINYWWVSRNDPGKFNSFVANRLQIIADLTRPDQWAWLHGGSNPADDLTRGVPALKLMKRSTFFEGPDFLRKSEDTWPSAMTIKGQESELELSSRPEMLKEPSSVFLVCTCPDPCIENRFRTQYDAEQCSDNLLNKVKNQFFINDAPSSCNMSTDDTGNIARKNYLFDAHAIENHVPIVEVEKFSCLRKLFGVTEQVFNFCNRLLKSLNRELRITRLSNNNAAAVENYWLLSTQIRHFNKEMIALHFNSVVCKKSRIYSLKPQLNDIGILEMHGRVDRKYDLSRNANPFVLPKGKNSHFTTLLILHQHVICMHAGLGILTFKLRCMYWILAQKQSIERALKICAKCAIFRAKFQSQSMANLPSLRFEKTHQLFQYASLDCSGPYEVKIGNKRSRTYAKMYYLHIIDVQLRLTHIEYCMSANTDDLLSALERFANRFCCFPETIITDGAGNFRLANSFLNEFWEELDMNKINHYVHAKKCTWTFTPAFSQWRTTIEPFVQLTKKLLYPTIFREKNLSFDAFISLGLKAASLINNRPYMNPRDVSFLQRDIQNSLCVITPGHFISCIQLGRWADSADWAESAEAAGGALGSPSPAAGAENIDDDDTVDGVESEHLNPSTKKLANKYFARVQCFEQLRERFFDLYWSYLLKENNKKWKKTNALKIGTICLLNPRSEMKTKKANLQIATVQEAIISHDQIIRTYVLKTLQGRLVRRSIQNLAPLEFETW